MSFTVDNRIILVTGKGGHLCRSIARAARDAAPSGTARDATRHAASSTSTARVTASSASSATPVWIYASGPAAGAATD